MCSQGEPGPQGARGSPGNDGPAGHPGLQGQRGVHGTQVGYNHVTMVMITIIQGSKGERGQIGFQGNPVSNDVTMVTVRE